MWACEPEASITKRACRVVRCATPGGCTIRVHPLNGVLMKDHTLSLLKPMALELPDRTGRSRSHGHGLIPSCRSAFAEVTDGVLQRCSSSCSVFHRFEFIDAVGVRQDRRPDPCVAATATPRCSVPAMVRAAGPPAPAHPPAQPRSAVRCFAVSRFGVIESLSFDVVSESSSASGGTSTTFRSRSPLSSFCRRALP